MGLLYSGAKRKQTVSTLEIPIGVGRGVDKQEKFVVVSTMMGVGVEAGLGLIRDGDDGGMMVIAVAIAR
jgi:hypothetical protein